jgi:hypothetical protein
MFIRIPITGVLRITILMSGSRAEGLPQTGLVSEIHRIVIARGWHPSMSPSRRHSDPLNSCASRSSEHLKTAHPRHIKVGEGQDKQRRPCIGDALQCSEAAPAFKALCSSGKLLTETFLAADVVAGSSTDVFPALVLSVFVQTVFSG